MLRGPDTARPPRAAKWPSLAGAILLALPEGTALITPQEHAVVEAAVWFVRMVRSGGPDGGDLDTAVEQDLVAAVDALLAERGEDYAHLAEPEAGCGCQKGHCLDHVHDTDDGRCQHHGHDEAGVVTDIAAIESHLDAGWAISHSEVRFLLARLHEVEAERDAANVDAAWLRLRYPVGALLAERGES